MGAGEAFIAWTRSEFTISDVGLLGIDAGEDGGADLVFRAQYMLHALNDLKDDGGRDDNHSVTIRHHVVAGVDGDPTNLDPLAKTVSHPTPNDVARGEVAAPDAETRFQNEGTVAAAAVHDVAPHAFVNESFARKFTHVRERGIVGLADDDPAGGSFGKKTGPLQQGGVRIKGKIHMAAHRVNASGDRARGIQRAKRLGQQLIRMTHGAQDIVNGAGITSLKAVGQRVGRCGWTHGEIILACMNIACNKIYQMKRVVAQVPALERGLLLLEWIAGQSEPVTLTQIARGLELGIPEVQRPVACLEELGYLRRLATGAYELSGRLFGVASRHAPLARLRRAAEPALAAFAEETGHSVHLSVPDGNAALMILDVPGSGLVRLSLRPGARFAPKDTLSGALLASADAISHRGRRYWPDGLVKAAREREPFSLPSRHAAGVIDCGIVLAGTSGGVVGVITCSAVAPSSGSFNKTPVFTALRKTAAYVGVHF